jgi:predicted RNA-binding protein (virulence factor B family)
MIEVFIYIDGEGYLAATTHKPKAQVGEIAWLQVIDANAEGAWLDWGVDEDLFLPRSEQQSPVDLNRYCMVRVLFDEKKGLYASSYLNDFLKDEAAEFEQGQQVSIMIGNATDLGYKVVINHTYWGLLYASEVFQPIYKGQVMAGYIKKLREDQRLDVSLAPFGFAKVTSITDTILAKLAEHNGFIALSDKSSPDDIYDVFGVSKKVFKQAIGILFKQRSIVIEATGIRLV